MSESNQHHYLIGHARSSADLVLRVRRECEAAVGRPGKFESNPRYVPYLWETAVQDGTADLVEDGDHDFPGSYRYGDVGRVHIDAQDVVIFPELEKVESVYLAQDENGFVDYREVRVD